MSPALTNADNSCGAELSRVSYVREIVMDAKSHERQTVCPICGERMTLSGEAAYYDESARYKTPVHYCPSCDVFCRDVDARKLISHSHAASYVQNKNEHSLLVARIDFFRWILSLVSSHLPAGSADDSRPPVLLDFGSSYGHLLSLAQEQRFHGVGIELNETLVSRSTKKGLCVYRTMEEFSGQVDAVTAVDSFYYVADPRALLADIQARLKPNGVLLIRITNRNLWARLNSRLVHKGDLSVIGDATIGYSARSIRRLLSSSGFRIVQVIPDYGQGKKLGLRKRLLYLVSYVLTLATLKRYILTPGIVVIAKNTGAPATRR